MDSADNLNSARLMNSLFPDSVLLVSHGVAHATLNAPSECIWEHTRAFYNDGKLPEANTTCTMDELPFGVSAWDWD
jgi:hypothetical protein